MDGYRAIRSRSDCIITSSRIRCSLGTCFLWFACFTLSLQYIYTRWSLSACTCSLHTLSPSPDLNKTLLASLSPHCAQRAGRIRPPGREGGLMLSPLVREGIHYRRNCSLSPSGGAGGPPTPSSSPPSRRPPNHAPRTLRYNLLTPHALL